MPLLADGFQFALRESTLSGVIICAILFVLSCFSWAIMITKARVLWKARRQSERFHEIFRKSGYPLQLFVEEAEFPSAPLAAVYTAGCREVAFQMLGSPEIDETFKVRLRTAERMTPTQMESVTTALERAVGEMVLRLESQMTLLATTVSGAPFLGLLGTVWGVMDTFGGVAAAEGAASLKTMAPGVSAALVTTVVGLLVAIPAMFGYNMLVNSVRKTAARLDNFAAELAGAIGRRYVDHGRRVTVAPGASAPAVVATTTVVRPPVRRRREAEAATGDPDSQPALFAGEGTGG